MFGLIFNSLRFYWRTHLGVLAGALLASAVLTGALLVGDSVKFSLRMFATQRLGAIEYAANTRDQYFQQSLASVLGARIETKVAAALQLPGMAIYQGTSAENRKQINQVQVLGVETDFWQFADGDGVALGPNETAISVKLATALGVNAGDEISLRVAKPSLMARDAPLSWRGEERSERGRYTIKKVLSDDALGRFSLTPSQVAPYNAYVDRRWLQEQAELDGRTNLLLVGETPADVLAAALKETWTLEHIGLHLRAHESGVVQLDSDRVFLDGETARAALTLPEGRGSLTYLVNSIAKGSVSTPYAFAVAGSTAAGLGDDEVVINRWTAEHLDAGVGDVLTIGYSELQASNAFVEKTRDFMVHSIREMATLEMEEALMPTFPGLSDVESCSDWDVGMPMDDALLSDPANEEYWETYHQTPKAFITLRAGQEIWGNRFGNLTAVRYPGGEGQVAALRAALTREMDPALAGLFFQPVGMQAEAAISQAMNFGGLFIGMSFFLIVAALMLTGLLFVFGVQQRAAQMGTLLAVGFRPGRVRALLLGEGFVVAVVGAVVGAGLGTVYTRALIYGLSQYWQGAVANSAIQYHATGQTLVLGAVISFVCAMVAMTVAIWRQSKHSARELLTRDFTQDAPMQHAAHPGKRGLVLPIVAILVAVAIVLYAQLLDITQVTPAFFGAGSLLLMAGLGLCRHGLILLNTGVPSERPLTLGRLALQNVARRQGRSLAVVALLASGCFLVFAVGAMQEDLTAHAHLRSSGTGGFALVAETTLPLLENPLAEIEVASIAGAALKVRDGDDASCLNLNRAQTPSVFGVNPADMAARGAFASEAKAAAMWELLNAVRADGAIPALVGDSNTAMFNLMKRTGVEKGAVLVYQDEAGNEVNVKLVGALPMRLSVFQGAILIADTAFTRLYPSESGHRMFLIDAPPGQHAEVATALREKFDRFGLDAVPAVQRLLEFYAVETTYLAMFMVLGGLGLLIGSAGMGVVILRNLLDRRGEMAMLRALGFHRNPIYRALFTEYGFLLAAGLAIGGIAAAVAMLPAVLAAESTLAVGTQVKLAIAVVLISVACMVAAIRAGAHEENFSALRSE